MKDDYFFGAAVGILMTLVFGFAFWINSTIVRYTYDSRPYIQTHGKAYMLISDEPMKIKSVNVVESKGK